MNLIKQHGSVRPPKILAKNPSTQTCVKNFDLSCSAISGQNCYSSCSVC